MIATVGCNVGGAAGVLTITAGTISTSQSVSDGDVITLSGYSLPEGSNDLTFNISVGGAPGSDVSYPISVDTSAPANLVVGYIKDGFDTTFDTCAPGYADHCLLAGAASTDVSAYVQTLYVSVDAEDGACPFDIPVLVVDGGADIDGTAFSLINDTCRSTFADVTLSDAGANPDGLIVSLSLSVSDTNGNTMTGLTQSLTTMASPWVWMSSFLHSQ